MVRLVTKKITVIAREQSDRGNLSKNVIHHEIATVTIVPSMPERVKHVRVILTKRVAVH